MLFDLQSPHRRRAVRIVFGGLALVFAISFVGFGVGSGSGSGGFLNNLFGGGGGGSASSAFDSDIQAAQKQLQLNPSNTTALANLIRLQYSAAVSNVNSNGSLSSGSEQHLRQGADAWNRYVKASKGNLQQGPALFAFQTFEQLGTIDFQKARTDTSTSEALTDATAAVTDWKTAAQAQQALVQTQHGKNASSAYAKLAFYLYLSGQTKAAQQAAAKAGKSVPASQLKQVQQLGQQFQTAIKQLTKQQQKTQSATGGGNPFGGISSGGLGGAGTGGGLSGP